LEQRNQLEYVGQVGQAGPVGWPVDAVADAPYGYRALQARETPGHDPHDPPQPTTYPAYGNKALQDPTGMVEPAGEAEDDALYTGQKHPSSQEMRSASGKLEDDAGLSCGTNRELQGGLPGTGAWGLAVMGGVCVGMGLRGSEHLCCSLLATAGLIGAVLVTRFIGKKDAATPRILIYLTRLLYLTPLWPGLVWSASSPWFHSTAENTASALCVGVAIGCLVSTFGLPQPVGLRRLRLLNLGTLLAPLAVVLLGLITANKSVLLYPANISENYGFSSNATVSATMPLGEVILEENQSNGYASPVSLPVPRDKTGQPVIRFEEGLDCPWATIETAADRSSGETFGNTFHARATLNKRPTFFSIEIRDMPMPRGTHVPFALENLEDVLNSLAQSLSDLSDEDADTVVHLRPASQLSFRRGHRVRIVWWYPSQTEIEASLVTTSQGVNRVEVTAQAVYLNESYLGLRLAQPDIPYTNRVVVSSLPLYQ
jgi:hypothetical protein